MTGIQPQEKKQSQQAFDDQEEEDNKSAASDFSIVSQPEDGEADGNGNTNNDEMGMPTSGNLEKQLEKCMADIASLNVKIDTNAASTLADVLQDINKEFREYRDAVEKRFEEKDQLIAKQQLELTKLAKLSDHLEAVNTAKCYAMTLPAPNASRQIVIDGWYGYSRELSTFIRHGGSLCTAFHIINGMLTEYPKEFFNELLLFAYETDKPEEIVPDLLLNPVWDDNHPPADWPKPLIQLLVDSVKNIGGDSVQAVMDIPGIVEEGVDHAERLVHYCFGNKHKPEFRFDVRIHFAGTAKVYKQMSRFCMTKC